MKFKATISYRITEDHPDWKWRYFRGYPSRKLTYTDIYTFNEEVSKNISKEAIVAYIKADLALVAGGGYDSDHIRDVDYIIEEVTK